MLFVTFLLSGIVLFLIIYAYSVIQLKKHNSVYDTVVEPAAGTTKLKIFFLDKLKPKSSTPDDDDTVGIEDSSMTVGGVTAKVASSIIDSVKPSNETVLSKEDRVEPTLSKTTESDIDEDSIGEKTNPRGFEPAKPNLEKIEADKAAAKLSAQESIVQTNDVSLETLAKEHAAKETVDAKVTPDEIAQALAEQIQSNVDENISLLSDEQTQQDLLAGQSLHPSIDIAVDAKIEINPPSPSSSENPVEIRSEVGLGTAAGSEHIKQSLEDTKSSGVSSVNSPTHSGNLAGSSYESVYATSPEKKGQQQTQASSKEFKAGANAIEIVAKISGADPVLRDKALTIYRRYDYLFTRHIGIYGKNSLTHVWGDIEQSGQEDQFDDIAVSLQLADKTGAMTRKESNTFSTMSIEMADELNKKMEFSMDIDESVEKGRMLDELARKYDAMVVCNIIPKRRKGFRSTDIKSCTKDLQMLPAKNGVFGRFAKVGELNSLRYSLALADSEGEYIPVSTRDPFQVDEIVVFMNVPLVKNPAEAFDSMIRDARKLAAWMDGKIVDKNARNMTSRTLEKIAEQIAVIEKEMSLDGLMPGSQICKKLF